MHPSIRNLEALPAPSASRAEYLTRIFAGLGASEPEAIAAGVLDQFGSLAAFASADLAILKSALPTVPALPPALVAAQKIALAGIRERAVRSRIDPANPAFLDYLRLCLASRRTEILLGFFATIDGEMLCERTLAISEGHSITISAAAILREAITVSARQIVIVHNHPLTGAHPSRADRTATRELAERAAVLDIQLLDHLIVGGSDVFSMSKERVL